MTKKLQLGILYGGRSGEHDVSLMSARSVLSVIDRDKFDVIEIGISRKGQWLVGENLWTALKDERYEGLKPAIFLPTPQNSGIYVLDNGEMKLFAKLDVVFPVMHGTFSEDGTLQGLLELADIAYVGAGVLGSSVCMDKGLFKDVMIANDIPALEYAIFNRTEIASDIEAVLDQAESVAPYPLFTKPANLGSSVGISKCASRSDLMEGLMQAASFDRRIVVERGVDQAREVEVSVLGNETPEASVPGEIVPKDIFYTYAEKYINDTADLLVPADISPETVEIIRDYAVRAYRATDCAGMARVDFLIDRENGDLFLNEINTIPGFTKISMYPKLWEASGLPYATLIERLIELALARKAQRDQTEREFRV
ncbi:MAG: D-alanine--D-alanine ligase family protein [Chloroflexota bacterium]|nr:D-alanine--D-alanine ligase family protein [Chloroflexota bacterium]